MAIMESKDAQSALAARYNVKREYLWFNGIWDAPEVGRTLLIFLITDPSHSLYNSNVTHSIDQSHAVAPPVKKILTNDLDNSRL